MPVQPPIFAPALLTALILAAGSMAAADAKAQAIVKWTDESGHVHYSDHAPPGHTPVSSVAAPTSSSGSGATPSTVPGNAVDPQNPAQAANNAALASEYDTEQSAAEADRKQKLQREQTQQAMDAARKKSDQATIDRCIADHNPNCSDGAKAIRERSHMAAMMQCTTPAACRNVEEIWQNSQNSGN